MLTVRFRRMWSGFSATDNSLIPLLERASGQHVTIVQSRRAEVDVELGSVYPTRSRKAATLATALARRGARLSFDPRAALAEDPKSQNASVGIWYTPENIRPPMRGWDVTLSYEVSGWPDNAYLPFWLLNSDAFGPGHDGFLGRPLNLGELLTPRESRTDERPGFCCAILRNPEPTRLKAIDLLREIGPVDVYGPAVGRPVPDKYSVMRNYRFALCFENSLYPGYVTEKVFDAWSAGCVPLYWGLDMAGHINPAATVNAATQGGLEGLVEAVSRLESHRGELRRVASAAILSSPPDVQAPLILIERSLRAAGLT